MPLRSTLFKTMVPVLFGVHYAYSGNKSRSKSVTNIIQRDKGNYEKKGESCFLYKYYSSYNPNPYPTDEFDCVTINQAFRDKGFKGVLYLDFGHNSKPE